MGLFDDDNLVDDLVYMDMIDKENKKKKENNSIYTEEELDNYGLEEWEKEEVRQGNFDPWNFDEEDLEEDDYYYEDEE